MGERCKNSLYSGLAVISGSQELNSDLASLPPWWSQVKGTLQSWGTPGPQDYCPHLSSFPQHLVPGLRVSSNPDRKDRKASAPQLLSRAPGVQVRGNAPNSSGVPAACRALETCVQGEMLRSRRSLLCSLGPWTCETLCSWRRVAASGEHVWWGFSVFTVSGLKFNSFHFTSVFLN